VTDAHRPDDTNGPGATDVGGPTDPDAIQAEIEATREHLSQTIEELSHRLDVAARAKESAYRARDTAVETYRESPSAVLGAGLAVVALVVGVIVWRRKRASSKSAASRRKR
jgi:hypothetical protein